MSLQALRTACCLALPFFAAASSSSAQDIFVDAVQGDDSNDGASAASAFRTLTRGLAGGSTGPIRTVVVAPGIYDEALGESFPLNVARRRDIQGQRGAVIDAGGAPVALRTAGRSSQPALGIRGVDVRNAGTGIAVSNNVVFIGGATISDCDVGLSAQNSSAQVAGSLGPIGCTIEGCRVGIRTDGRFRLSLQASRLRDIQEDGVQMRYEGSSSVPALFMAKSTILDCGASAFRFEASPGANLRLNVMTSILGASAIGFEVSDTTEDARLALNFFSCTFPGNQVGLHLDAPSTMRLQMAESILAGNGLDIAPGSAVVDITNSLVEGGQYAGEPGVIAGDPQFVDPAVRNYRLRPSSPAIDAAAPFFYAASTAKLSGALRCDGDQDGQVGLDFGAHAFDTLRVQGPALSGAGLPLQVFGEEGASGIVFRASGIPQVQGFALRTSLGLLELDRSTMTPEVTFSISPGENSASIVAPISDDPAMIGQSFLYQAVITSSSSPAGRAFTNRISAVIMAP